MIKNKWQGVRKKTSIGRRWIKTSSMNKNKKRTFQIIESKVIGADCILLIVACLTREKFSSLLNFSKSLDLDVLVEVHDEYELDLAMEFDCKMIGINNRNLKTFDVSTDTSKILRKKIVDDNVVVISESGIKDINIINSLNASKIHAFLIGESLIINNDPAALLKRIG